MDRFIINKKMSFEHINTHKVWNYLYSQVLLDATNTREATIIEETVDYLDEVVSEPKATPDWRTIVTLFKRDIDIYAATCVPIGMRPYFYTLTAKVIDEFMSVY